MMKIYRNNVEIYDLEINEKTVIAKRLMIENTLTLNIESETALHIHVLDYILIGNERYVLNEQVPYEQSGGKYNYTYLFQGRLHQLDYLLMPDDGQDDYFYFGTLTNHIHFILQALTAKEEGWTVVMPNMAAISAEPKNINYGGLSIFGAINKLCNVDEGYGIEFDIIEQEITFAKSIRRETTLVFEFGQGRGLYKLSRGKIKNNKITTRLYGYGGTTNMLDGRRIYFEERFLEKNKELYGLKESRVSFDHIYPRRNGKITSDAVIVTEGKANWTVVDNTMDFDLNSLIVEGAVIQFNNGDCAGTQFEIVAYDAATKKITFKEYADSGQTPAYILPNALRYPRAGDEYCYINIIMPESYKLAAQEELKQAVQEELDKLSTPQHPYTIDCDYKYLKKLGFLPAVGDLVKIKDSSHGLDAQIRCTGIEYPVLNPYAVSLTISDDIPIPSSVMQQQEVKRTQERVEVLDKRAEVSARKQNKALQELSNYLLDTEGYFDTDKFKALSIEARMLAVGMQAQNFTLSGIRVTPNSGDVTTVVVTPGTLTHASLEIENLGSCWAISGETLIAPDTAKAYYIYAKCSKMVLQGTIEISETEFKVEQFPNYYVFNLGVLYPLREGESWRDYSATYGVTSIVGDQIYGGGIKALDGFNFIDLRTSAANGRFRLGKRSGGSIDYGVTEPDTLTLTNTKLVSRSGVVSYPQVFRGAWTNAELYYAGDSVSYDGSTYLCIKDCPTAGIIPTHTIYWELSAAKGQDVDPATIERLEREATEKANYAKEAAIQAAKEFDDAIQIGGTNLMLNSKQIELNGAWYNSTPRSFSRPLIPGKNYILSVSNMVDGLYFRIYPAGGGWETGVNVPFNTTFTVHGEFTHGIFYAGIDGVIATAQLEEGNRITDWSPAPEDINSAIADAKAAGTAAQTSANTANTNVNALKNFTDSAFADGIIDRAESVAIEKYKNTVNESFNDLQQTYTAVYNNTYLEVGIASNNLHAAMTGLTTCKDNLLTAITTAIADGKTTVAEKNDVDNKYTAYSNAVGTFKTALENANKAIQTRLDELSKEYIDNIEIGGVNLVRNSDFSSGLNNWIALVSNAVGVYDNTCTVINEFNNGANILGAPYIDLLAGETYTVSADIQSDNLTQLNYNYVLGSYFGGNNQAINWSNISSTWQRKSVTFISIWTQRAHIGFGVSGTIGSFKVKNFKIEKGNKSSGYSLNPNETRVGGENLLEDTDRIFPTNGKEYTGIDIPLSVMKHGEQYVWSFDLKVEGLSPSSISVYNQNSGSMPAQVNTVITANSEWKRYYVTFAANFTGTTATHIQMAFYGGYDSGRIPRVRRPMLQKGFLPTEWQPAPYDLISQAAEKSAKELGFTKIEQGLIQSSHIKLMQPGGSESAGISGITTRQTPTQKFLPAFWGGGTYANAAMGKTSLMLDHGGNGKIGALNIEPDGNVFMKDATGVPRVEWNASEIDLLSVIKEKAYSSVPSTITGSSETAWGTTDLRGQIYVANNGSKLTIKSDWMISIECDKISAHGYCSAELDMYRNGKYYANISIISIELQDKSSATHREDISTELNSVPEGTYTFKLSFYPDGRANFMERVWLSDIAVTAIYTTDQKRFKFGLNGIIAFYDKFKYLYLNEADGEVFFSIAGNTDMPGVLAAYSVLYNGSTKNEWGGKINTLKKTKRISLGNYDIYHTIGHINYMVTANVVNSSGTYICMIGQKNNDSVKIVIKDLANNLSDQNFDIVITGSNV